MTNRLLLEGLMDSMRDADSVGDKAGVQMLDDIIDGYLGGWVDDSNARAALFASERRIRKLREQQKATLHEASALGYTEAQKDAAWEDGAWL